ncbi:MAG: 4-(cytidine 5'-diphospho)-2-C-methyl-D-erythritol kinase, partial [Rhizobiales bacterium]|nr:4-(cytidine 5'-diphospho)-2-C-methyl-D-erythritol kinase [Hyphomicrobiales bacterium]
MPARARAERAPAKINLTLRVIGRRADGYHELESLVAFAGVGDTVTFTPARTLALTVDGPTAAASGSLDDNLVMKAARALAERVEGLKLGRFALSKRLPVAAGIGGGSSDAAAALRLLARANRIALDDTRLMEAAYVTGADVPVCVELRARMMFGIGELLSDPADMPKLPAVLVNPGVAVPTKDVFAALSAHRKQNHEVMPGAAFEPRRHSRMSEVIEAIATQPNDLEAPA